ncbi:MAG: energy-dependent translational throttle protein EttA [Planctomycetes bacterium]|jgi:ATP-binding cassette ChvD family protein|nr:energy-dependent translational throttle protein EttA [Planctomycetota bacterium]MBT6542121.1 energy-dependent translational throttle protein EttA [Planctomycetota bacterium]MBT7103796.1 energy-dependent translational throttle protein EttA [Planctomycetota bacterium]
MSKDRQEVIFQVQDVYRSFGPKDVLKGVTLGFFRGAKIGLIGVNGSGKSTLLKIIAGVDDGYDGTVTIAKGATIGYVPQEPVLDETKTVRENVEIGAASVRKLLDDYNEVTESLATELSESETQKAYDKMASLQEKIDDSDAWEIDRQIDQAMHALSCPEGDSEVGHLSGGEKRRIALCRTLLSHPDILLLDEPTNHLDADTVAWLERHLANFNGTVLLITHDRYFLDNVVGWMLEMDRGRGTPFEGNYSQYLKQKTKELDVEKRHEDDRQKLLTKELDWIRQTPKARATKSKARVEAFHRLQEQVYESRKELPALVIPCETRLGDKVLDIEKMSKGFDGRVLFEDLSFSLRPGSIVGVIGPNGAGKTTLMRLVAGLDEPDSGTIELGSTVEICFADQSRQDLNDKKTIYQNISEGYDVFNVGKLEVQSRAYVARFGFTGDDQEKLVGHCSGGMRNRVQMAKMLRRGGNLVILDEPTNDLDIPTLRLLEEALEALPGCGVVVSHDRYFLDRVATHILALDGVGSGRFFEGSYQAYAEKMRQERTDRGEDPDLPRGVHRRFA